MIWGREFTEIKSSLARIEENLKEHMRRTAIQEGKMESVEKHVHAVQGAGVFIGILALVTTIVGAVFAYFQG